MHQRVLHILAYASDQVNVVDKQFFEKALRDVSLVRHEFSEDLLRKLLVFQRSTIICVGLRQLPLDDFSAVVDNDVQFETEEPTHSPFATCGKSPKGFVSSRSLVVTHPNGGGINDRDVGAVAQTTVIEKLLLSGKSLDAENMVFRSPLNRLVHCTSSKVSPLSILCKHIFSGQPLYTMIRSSEINRLSHIQSLSGA